MAWLHTFVCSFLSSGTVSAVAVNTRVNCIKDQVYVARTANATPLTHHSAGSWSKTSKSSEIKFQRISIKSNLP